MDLYSIHTVSSTREQRPCVWCPEPIEAGTPSVVRAYTLEGRFAHDRMHPECAEACSTFPFEPDDTFSPHEFKRGSHDLN